MAVSARAISCGASLRRSYSAHKPLAAGDADVEKVSLQHGVVLCHDRNHYRGVLVDARGVCRY